MPRLDMVTGLYHLTKERPGATGEGHVYSSLAEAIMAYDRKVLHLQAPIKIRLTDVTLPVAVIEGGEWQTGEPWLADTTLGRVMFNELPSTDYPFYVNDGLLKKRQAAIINELAERYR